MILTSENLPHDMRGYNFNIILMDSDTTIGETICKNSDDSFTIFINSRLSSAMQRYCFEHALNHVRRNDWEKDNVQSIEFEAHKEIT